MTSMIHVWQRRSWLLPSTSPSRCRHPAPGQDLIPLQRLHVFAHSRGPHPAIKVWCQVPFTKSKTIFQIEMYCMQCFLKSKYIKSRTFNDKNRWIIKKVMVLKKLLPHVATRGTYSPGDWRCDEAWREQTLGYPPVMCQQRLTYCTWELSVMLDRWRCSLAVVTPVKWECGSRDLIGTVLKSDISPTKKLVTGVSYTTPRSMIKVPQIAKFMGPTWDPPGSCRPPSWAPCRPREPCYQGHWYHGFSIEKSWDGSEANIMYLNLKKSKWFIQQLLSWIHSKFMFLVKNEMGIKLHLKLCRLKR